MKKLLPLVLLTVFHTAVSQPLRPGFDRNEYLDMLSIAFQPFDAARGRLPAPKAYHVVYRSPEVGLHNRWNMWYRNDDSVAVVSIRGTVGSTASWLENFYAAMIPAKGSLQLNDSTVFTYQLAADERAMVHTGWTIGLGYLAPTIKEQVQIAVNRGIHRFIIAGHSQGGALSILLTSYLYYLEVNGGLPQGLTFKTYASAAPKTGNLYYAYDYDFITRSGWAFTIVNAADWVPESPFSIQTLSDFNELNPFANVTASLSKMPWYARWYVKGKFNKINRSTRKAQKRFEKYLGHTVYKRVKPFLPQLKEPAYTHGNNYQRAGSPVVLQPDSAYHSRFPGASKNTFSHHSYQAYYQLTMTCYPR